MGLEVSSLIWVPTIFRYVTLLPILGAGIEN